jgi:hypothetical protein
MSKNGHAARGHHVRVFPQTSYWRRQEQPRLVEQQLAAQPGVKVFPDGRIVGDDADRWLRQHP